MQYSVVRPLVFDRLIRLFRLTRRDPGDPQFYSFANYPSERLGGYDKPIEAVVRAVAELGVARSADERA